MTNFDIIRNEGRLLYEYIRGSHLYGLNNEDSDVDTSGVYLCTTNELLGCFGYKPQVSDSRHDNTWYEIGELMRLLLKSNPTVLECLFVPSDMILGPVHPLMQMVIAHREQFISKQCFNPFVGYAKSQIEKARGLNKKIVNPVTQRLSPYDFIYTFKGQGSTKFRDWLENRHLHQTYCGLVNVPNMHDIYGVYYDFGAHTAAHEHRELHALRFPDDLPRPVADREDGRHDLQGLGSRRSAKCQHQRQQNSAKLSLIHSSHLLI